MWRNWENSERVSVCVWWRDDLKKNLAQLFIWDVIHSCFHFTVCFIFAIRRCFFCARTRDMTISYLNEVAHLFIWDATHSYLFEFVHICSYLCVIWYLVFAMKRYLFVRERIVRERKTWLNHMSRDSFMRRDSFMFVLYCLCDEMLFACVWKTDMTFSYMRHDRITGVMTHPWDVPYSCVQHDSFISHVTRL